MSSLFELIERVEKASGPDCELDVAVILTLFPGAGPYQPYCKGDEPIFFNEPYRKQECPKLTASIDAALTLLPDGYAIDRLSIWKGSPSRCIVLGTHLKRGEYWHIHSDGMWEAEAATPALAITAACLKARLLDAASSEAADQ